MVSFGELISIDKPVLIDFYENYSIETNPTNILKDVSVAMGNTAKIIKIDIKKNEILSDFLGIDGNPTFIIYKNGKMKWRKTGYQNAETLISILKQYV